MPEVSIKGRFKNRPVAPHVVRSVRMFHGDRKNAIRGIISEVERGGLTRASITDLRNNSVQKDMALASMMLNGPSGLRKRKIEKLTQSEIPWIHDLEHHTGSLEANYASGFLNSWPESTSKAIGTIQLLSSILEVDVSDAIGAIGTAVSEWGASNYIAWKIAFAKEFFDLNANQMSSIAEIDRHLGHSESPLLQYSALENMKDKISIFAVARRHTNTHSEWVEHSFRQSYSLHNLVPTPLSDEDCAPFLLRATESSLIDTVYAVWIILALSKRYPLTSNQIRNSLNSKLYRQIVAAIESLSDRTPAVFKAAKRPIDGSQDFEPSSLSLYRKASAFLEFSTLAKFRNDIDRVIGLRLVAPLLKGPPILHSEPINDIEIIKVEDSDFCLSLHDEGCVGIDRFYRTYLFLRLIQNPLNLALLESSEISFIFDNTMGLEALLSEHELRTMHLNASDEARPLISILALALHRSKSSDPDVDFDFRERLEEYIVKEFSGSVPNFIEHLAPSSPQVANYIATSLDDVTLQKMYSIIESPEKSDEVRREILTTIGFRLNRIEYIVEAEAIATRAKVSSLKDYFDTSRMYVDSVAMRKWLISTPSAYAEHYKELLPKITAKLAAVGTITTPDGSEARYSVLELTATDERLLSQIAKEAFREFCVNNEFGIESYLGRRIRHNTLHGVMTNAVDVILNRPEYRSVIEGTPFGRALQIWGSSYSLYIERMRREFLQFKSASKPNAIFDADVDLQDPATKSNVKQLVATLRLVGPEMLHDLVVSFCWRQVAPQLEFASRQIRVAMAREVAKTLDHALIRFNGPEEQKIRLSLLESVNSALNQIASWFQVPQTGFVPASIKDICNIIDLEHKRINIPTLVEGENTNVKYYGITVHRVYDCLAALLQNAFKHGEPHTPVRVNVRSAPIDGTNLHSLRVSVSSYLQPDEAAYSSARVEAAIRSSETGRDMVTEGYSGIKKVKFITKLNEGVSTVSHTIVGDEIELSFTIKAEVATEALDDE